MDEIDGGRGIPLFPQLKEPLREELPLRLHPEERVRAAWLAGATGYEYSHPLTFFFLTLITKPAKLTTHCTNLHLVLFRPGWYARHLYGMVFWWFFFLGRRRLGLFTWGVLLNYISCIYLGNLFIFYVLGILRRIPSQDMTTYTRVFPFTNYNLGKRVSQHGSGLIRRKIRNKHLSSSRLIHIHTQTETSRNHQSI